MVNFNSPRDKTCYPLRPFTQQSGCCFTQRRAKLALSIKVFLMLFLLSTFLIQSDVFAQITIDGNAADWATICDDRHVQDAFGNGVVDDQFTQGSKDFHTAAAWTWSISQTKAKNDIANGSAFLTNQVVHDGNVLNGTFLVFAGDRTSNNGDAQIGFWFFQNGTAPAPNNHFAPEKTPGDLLVLADFTGGGKFATVIVLEWVGTGGTYPNSNGAFNLSGAGAAVAENNGGSTTKPACWNFVQANYSQNMFYEGFVDLGAFAPGAACFSRFMLETRSSQSITAALDDFVGGPLGGVPDPPLLAKVDPTCTVATGCVTVTSSTAGLTFSIDGGAYAAYPDGGWCGLAPGEHCVTAKNQQGCVSEPTCITIPVQPPTPDAPSLGKVDPTCTVATGCVSVTSSTAGLTFSIDGGAYAAYPDGGWCGLAPGEHCVTAMNEHGCISEPTCITIPPQPPTPDAPSLGKVDPTCTVATGCVSVTSSTEGLTFSFNGGAYAAYPDGGWCDLAPGEYCVTAKNEHGCISEPTCITIPPQPPTPDAPSLGKVDPTCTVATGCVSVTSSTAGLTFSIDGGAYEAYPDGGWCGLAPGEHCVTAMNEHGCISEPTCITIPPQPPTPDAPSLGKVDPTCTVATGCVSVTSSTAGLTFSFDGGAYAAYPDGGWCDLAPGEYCVTAKNEDGCVSQPTCITIPPQPPTPDAPSLGKVDPTCTVATGCVSVTSMTAGLTFSFDGGAYAAYPDGGWCDLAPGEYCITAKNEDGCVSQPTCITIPPQPPTPDAPALDVVDPTCDVATGCVMITSSTAGLTFSIDGGEYAAYPDGGWCGLAPGEHCVTAMNEHGCISEPACITIAAPPTNCGEGCSLGFWKTHSESYWPEGWHKSDNFWTALGFAGPQCGLPNYTMQQALEQTGGGCKAVVRQGAAALLNYATFGAGYTLGDPTALLHDALASCSCTIELVAQLNEANNNEFDSDGNNICSALFNKNATTASARSTGGQENVSVTEETTSSTLIKTSVYPVPFDNEVTIEFSVPYDTRATVDLFTIDGRRLSTIFESDVKANEVNKATYSGSSLGTKLYLYRISTNLGVKYGKFIKR